eukprot:6177539-Pleurochrysis_carterae.AAC.3
MLGLDLSAAITQEVEACRGAGVLCPLRTSSPPDPVFASRPLRCPSRLAPLAPFPHLQSLGPPAPLCVLRLSCVLCCFSTVCHMSAEPDCKLMMVGYGEYPHMDGRTTTGTDTTRRKSVISIIARQRAADARLFALTIGGATQPHPIHLFRCTHRPKQQVRVHAKADRSTRTPAVELRSLRTRACLLAGF